MAIEVRRNGVWVDNTQEKKRVNGAWVSNSPYKVMKPTISGVPPFTFKSDGENLRDWSMSGQTVQASIPTPSSPVDVSGVGERTGNGWCVPVTCGGTTTNIYLGSATSTRRVKKLVLTGSEAVESVTESTLESGAYCFACLYSNLGMTDIIDYDLDMRDIPYPRYVSDHFKMRTTPTQQIAPYTDLYAGDMGANARKGGGTSNRTYNRYIIFCVSGISTVADFKTWLAQQYAAGTPVTIWYVLAEPETAATNEPLMKIGSYADELTKTSTGVDIPTVSGSNTLSVGTTVQPSEMSIESISQWV